MHRYKVHFFSIFLLGLFANIFYLHAQVEISTATGKTITFDNAAGVATVEGDAVVVNSTATLKADVIRINTNTKVGRAQGHVILIQSSTTLTGTEAEYYWEVSTGIIRGAVGHNDPFHFASDELIQTSPEFFQLGSGHFSTCNENPPHYHIHSSRSKIQRGKRLKLYSPRFVAEDTPTFWLPFYTRALGPKKYRLRIEPGQSSRDGITNRTIFGYPYTRNSYTDLRWDYLQRTGNGGGIDHRYFAPNQRGELNWYYIRDINKDPQPQSRRYSVLWDHYQRFTSKLTMNSKVDLKSDQIIGNQFQNTGNGVFIENKKRGLFSEVGFNYQFSMASLQVQLDRRDKFDTAISSKNFINHITLPRIILNTAPLKSKVVPFYTSFSGIYTNQTIQRDDPKQNLRYYKDATAGVDIKKDIRLAKKWTITPVLGYSQKWLSRVVTATTTISETDSYIGRYNAGLNVRRRIRRMIDVNTGYNYLVRNRPNQTIIDSQSNDYGIETNQLSTSLAMQLRRDTRVTLSSGYDLRESPRDQPDKYRHRSERFSPPSADMQWEIKKNVNLFFREAYSIFDQRTQSVIRTPLNTSGELQLGQITDAVFFSQGFSYTKPALGQKSQLFLNNSLKFYLTPKWYVDLALSYRAEADRRLGYSKTFPIQKSIRIVRDLHCWLLRAEFDHRTDRTDVSLYIDLKANLTPQRNIFSQYKGSVYSTRNDGPDISQIFPEK